MKMENYERLNYLCESTESTRILADIDGHNGTTENDVQSHKKKKTKTFKIVESVFLTCLFVSWGLSDAVIVPCTDDLRHLLNCNYEQVMRLTVARNIGVMIGGPLAALSLDRFERFRELQIGVTLLCSGLCLAAAPWCSSLALMMSLFFVIGLCNGSISCGGNAMTTQLWGVSATVPLLVIHFGYGIGSIVAPMIAGPFLAGYPESNNSSHTNASYDYEMYSIEPHGKAYSIPYVEHALSEFVREDGANLQLNNDTHGPIESRIYIPFGIIALLAMITAFMFLSVSVYDFCITKSVAQPINSVVTPTRPPFRSLISPASCADGNLPYGTVMLSLTVFLYVSLTGMDNSIFNFVTVLAVDRQLDFSLKEGTFITTMFYVSYSVGRLTAAFGGIFLNIKVLIFIDLALVCISQVLLQLFAFDSKTTFWLCMLFFAFCCGPIFPSGMAWIDRYLRMSNLAFSAITVGSGIGGFAFSWLSGYLMDHYAPRVLFCLSFTCWGVATLTLTLMQVIGAKHGDRFQNEQPIEVSVDGDDEPFIEA